MKRCFGYIRVSTAKQGQQGVSLQEQRDSILRYASRTNLEIASWYEERETAAKRGRPVFNQMMKLLRNGKADGVVLHKIDRGARNLKDWADIAELSDAGVAIHFSNESVDLQSRGGRLSADIQAVVAADYIRNLREETKKGFYGRIKQGLYPLPAPVGYLDKGKGQLKEPDPLTAPLIRKAFELYATGQYSLDALVPELQRLGLRNKKGQSIVRNGLWQLLSNPFYIGLIRIKCTGETFAGGHTPLVPKSLFDRVQAIKSRKLTTPFHTHNFLFRRLLQCELCGFTMIGERQKGHHYYRCHTVDCPTTGVREETVDAEIQKQLRSLCFSDEEREYFRAKVIELKKDWVNRQDDERKALNLQIAQRRDRLDRLTDAFLDGSINREMFEQRKSSLLMEIKGIEETIKDTGTPGKAFPDRLSEFLELAGNAWLSYQMGNLEEKRVLLQKATSNRGMNGKNVVVKLSSPLCEAANRPSIPVGDPTGSRTPIPALRRPCPNH
jgi:site-specific DNA recombinase